MHHPLDQRFRISLSLVVRKTASLALSASSIRSARRHCCAFHVKSFRGFLILAYRLSSLSLFHPNPCSRSLIYAPFLKSSETARESDIYPSSNIPSIFPLFSSKRDFPSSFDKTFSSQSHGQFVLSTIVWRMPSGNVTIMVQAQLGILSLGEEGMISRRKGYLLRNLSRN